MRDFSGKGSLWGISTEYRQTLLECLLKSCQNENHLLKNVLLKDVNESYKSIQCNNQVKISKNRSASSLNTTTPTVTNSNPTSKLSLPAPMITKINAKKSINNSSLLSIKTPETTIVGSNNNANCPNELDAVKALLSMKSRASSMPAQGSRNSELNNKIEQGRRKQVFKPPIKKPHLNPSNL